MAKLEVSSGGEKGSQTKKDYSFPKSAKFYFIFCYVGAFQQQLKPKTFENRIELDLFLSFFTFLVRRRRRLCSTSPFSIQEQKKRFLLLKTFLPTANNRHSVLELKRQRERWKEIDRRTRRINRLWIERARMNKKIGGKIELESIERQTKKLESQM